jgi:hypothetical protein
MFATIRSARTLLYNALPYDVLDGAYFETVELPEGPLTDIHVSSGERSSDFFTVSLCAFYPQNVYTHKQHSLNRKLTQSSNIIALSMNFQN